MIKGLPKKINDAIELLWKYADDACLSGRTKAECEEEGYDCKSEDGAHKLTFTISRRKKKGKKKKEDGKNEND